MTRADAAVDDGVRDASAAPASSGLPEPGRAVRPDAALVLLALGLSLFGAALIYSTTHGRLAATGDSPMLFAVRHLVNLALGVGLAAIVWKVGARWLLQRSLWWYALALLGLVAVLSPLGTEVNGTRAWLELPLGFSVQPSELAKPALILVVASVLTAGHRLTWRPGHQGAAGPATGPAGGNEASPADAGEASGSGERADPGTRRVLLALALAGVVMALIVAQPDLGTVLVIAPTILAVLAVSGASWWWPALLVLGGVATGVAAVLGGVLDAYQVDRLTAFLDPAADPQGAGYNTAQARIAIGAGGILGAGYLAGAQTQGQFVPYQQTDFVFSVAGEELGLVGAAAIVLALAAIVWRALQLAGRAHDRTTRMVAAGIAAWFGIQAFENIGMNIGIMPVTGVPLPFVSYGGTSMFACWIGIGLLLSLDASARRSAGPR